MGAHDPYHFEHGRPAWFLLCFPRMPLLLEEQNDGSRNVDDAKADQQAQQRKKRLSAIYEGADGACCDSHDDQDRVRGCRLAPAGGEAGDAYMRVQSRGDQDTTQRQHQEEIHGGRDASVSFRS